jgi:hypothetical protein
MIPVTYLLSGRAAMRSLMPGFTYRFWRALENVTGAITDTMGMFAVIVVEVSKTT